VLILALAALAIQLLAWALIGAGLTRVRGGRPPGDDPPPDVAFSVVVAARDEAARLPALLDALAAQSHRDFEIIVVDDRSTDGTAGIADSRAQSMDVPMRVLRVEAGEPEAAGLAGKKHAIERAIAVAAHGRVALTDADCRPGPHWLATLARHAAPDGDDAGAVLVGYGPYHRRPGLLNALVRYETAVTGVLTAAAIGLGRPFMAVGRNLSYPRGLLERLGGFAGAAPGLSGDDDLLVQAAARAGVPVWYVLDPAAHVSSDAPETTGRWLRQKRRHSSAGRRYPPAVLVALGVFNMTALLIWLAPVALGWTGAGLLAVRLLAQRLALRPAWAEFDAADLSFFHPLLDAGLAVYGVAFALFGALPAPRRW
jgi:cellulose synthase/poly-beta-1,6-N-acetylglucosamine synthase-like glycosyltransferase